MERSIICSAGATDEKRLDTDRKSFLATLGDLRQLKKNDWRKRLIGHLIKKRTGVSLHWIGEHLAMGTDSHVSRLCSRIDDLANPSQLSKYLKAIERRARQE
jgi:hypothetical protein